MTETKSGTTAPKGGGWLRKLAYVAGALVVLLIAAWFVVTSAGFFKGVILPRVGKAMNAEITVADASISPLSRVVLRDLKVTPKGAEPLLAAGEVRARYSLLAILRGNILVDEVAVVNPTITLVENADGTSNLDPLLKAVEPAGEKKPATPAKPSPPPSLDIKTVRLDNATVRQTRNLKGGGHDVIEISNLNVTLTDLKNGQTGKLDLAATVAMDQAAQASTPASSLAGKLTGAFTFDLAEDLKPTALNGNATLIVDKAAGAFADFAALTVQFDAQASPTEIKQLAVRFSKGAESLGELRVSGPFDAAKLEGKLKVELTGVDKKLLNLAGAANGLDFGNSTVGLTSNVELTKAGTQMSVDGQLNIARFQVTREGQTTPTLDLRGEFRVSVDSAAESAVLTTLNLTGTQGQRPLLQAALTAPMTIAWGTTANAVGDSALNLTVNALDLADWKPFIGDVAPAGKVDVTAKLLSQQAGPRLQFEAKVDANNLVVLAGTNRFAGLSAGAEASGEASELKRFKLTNYAARLAHNGQQVLSAEGAGNCDTGAKTADADARVLVALPALVQLLGVPDVTAASGAVELQSRLTHHDTTQTATGKVLLVGFTGGFGETRLEDFGLETEFDVVKTDQTVQLRKAVGKVTERMQGCGDFEATGNYDLAASAGNATLKLAGLNQNALRPFLAAALGDKRLVSVVVNSSVTANLAANGDAGGKADLHVTNLVVNDPKGALPATPLEARLQADAGVAKQVAQVRQLLLTLTPTERAENELSLAGSVDFSKSNAVTGNLKLTAAALDVTRYYDLFAGDAATTKPAAPATAPATDPTKEPDAIPLPFRNFTFDASVGRFHLREVAITNLQATAQFDGGHVVVKPFQFTLNGAPVSATADLDLGVPGFKYDVNLSADKVPLAPLVNSFVPERKGQMGGVTTVGAQIKGAGVTGAGLQKNLTGQFSVLSTNLNLSIANVRSPVVNAIINVIVGIPDLIRNPTAIVGNLLGSLTGADRPRGGWADQLTAAPIDVIVVRGNAGAGRVELQAAEIRSTAFQAQAGGGIGLERILTNSTLRIPLTVSFSRAMADRVGLVTADIPTNQVYVALPDFVSLKGTVGEPKADINKLALAGLAARTGAGVVKQIGGASGGKAGDILGAVGSLLGGGTTAPRTNTPTATNRPPTDPAGNLLRGLGGILGGGRTSAPATNAPTSPR